MDLVAVLIATVLLVSHGQNMAMKPRRSASANPIRERFNNTNSSSRPRSKRDVSPPVSSGLLRLGYSAVSNGVSRMVGYLSSPQASVARADTDVSDEYSIPPSVPAPEEPLEPIVKKKNKPRSEPYDPAEERRQTNYPPRANPSVAASEGWLGRVLQRLSPTPPPPHPNLTPPPLPPSQSLGALDMISTPPPPSPNCEINLDAQNQYNEALTEGYHDDRYQEEGYSQRSTTRRLSGESYNTRSLMYYRSRDQGALALLVGGAVLLRGHLTRAVLVTIRRIRKWEILDHAGMMLLLLGFLSMSTSPILSSILRSFFHPISSVNSRFSRAASTSSRVPVVTDELPEIPASYTAAVMGGWGERLRVGQVSLAKLRTQAAPRENARVIVSPEEQQHNIEEIETSLSEDTVPAADDFNEQIPPPATNSLNISEKCVSLGNENAERVVQGEYDTANTNIVVDLAISGCNASKFWEIVFSDRGGQYFPKFHSHNEDNSLKYTKWIPPDKMIKSSESGEIAGSFREFIFDTRVVGSRIGPNTARIIKTQRLMQMSGTAFVVESSSSIQNIPYGQSFVVVAVWNVKDEGDGCRVIVRTQTHFLKQVFIASGMIRHTVRQSTTDWYASIMAYVQERLSRDLRYIRKRSKKLTKSDRARTRAPLPKTVPEDENNRFTGVSAVFGSLSISRIFVMEYVGSTGIPSSNSDPYISRDSYSTNSDEIGKLVNFLLQTAKRDDMILLRLTSRHDTWAAAAALGSELSRLKRLNVTLSCAVDHELIGPMFLVVAALADNVIAAPFAVLAPPSAPSEYEEIDGGALARGLWRAARVRRPGVNIGGRARLGKDASPEWVDYVDTADGLVLAANGVEVNFVSPSNPATHASLE